MDQNIYNPNEIISKMIIKNFVWGMLGLVLGVIVNNIVIKTANTFDLRGKNGQNILQILLCSVVLAMIHNYNNYFGWTWQNVTPGLFFVSFFFGTQFKIMTNVNEDYTVKENIIEETNK